jgi:hypothetical protein
MKKLTLFIFVAFAALQLGCEQEDGDTGPAGATGNSALVGSVFGNVVLVNEFGSNSTVARNQAVTFEGPQAATAQADSTGRFVLQNIKAGTYRVIFQRPGYGTTTIEQLPVLGVRAIDQSDVNTDGESPITLDSLPSYRFTGDTLNQIAITGQLVTVEARMASRTPAIQGNPSRRVRFYFSNSQAVSNTDFLLEGSDFQGNSATDSLLVNSFNRGTFTGSGMPVGSRVYVIAYPASTGGRSGYKDPITERFIYTAVGTPTARRSFLVP